MPEQFTRQNLLRKCLGGFLALAVIVVCSSVVTGAYSHETERPHFTAQSTSQRELLHKIHADEMPSIKDKVTPSRHASHVVWMKVTAYCACKKCCGPHANGITASGRRVSFDDGKFVAADTSRLPFGTKLSIPGYHHGEVVEVIDRGGAIRGNHLDVFFPSHERAMQWGVKWLPVTVEN